MIKVGIITISDKGSRGEREDLNVEEIKKIIHHLPATITAYTIIPDEEKIIIETLIAYADKEKLDIIITSGGTGLSPRDVTPEATKKVIDREVIGMAEAMRFDSLKITPLACSPEVLSGHEVILSLLTFREVPKESAKIFPPCYQ